MQTNDFLKEWENYKIVVKGNWSNFKQKTWEQMCVRACACACVYVSIGIFNYLSFYPSNNEVTRRDRLGMNR